MFGIDKAINALTEIFKRIQEFFTLSEKEGVAGAFGTMASNTFNELTAKAEESVTSIPDTLKQGSDLIDQGISLFTGNRLAAESTTGPDGSAPASTPATPPAATAGQALS